MYFYQARPARPSPAMPSPPTKLEYQKDDGTWARLRIRCALNYAGANYNVSSSPGGDHDHPRHLHAAGRHGRRVKEIEAYNTGIKADGTSENQTRRWMLTCLPAPHLVPSSSVR
ncbi:MAG: hypothetical protein ACLS6O_00600 [Bifidobacterium sp.]